MGSTHLGSEQGAAENAAGELRTTTAIRARARQLLERARAGQSRWFNLDGGSMDTAANVVVDTTRARFPKLHIPLHSRWRHFEAGGVDRRRQLNALTAGMQDGPRAHTTIDLTVISVLLDGGAGPDWKYTEAATGKTFTRSEGLAVASFHAFMGGLFSGDRDRPLQADSTGLRALVTDHLARAFQVTPNNPIVGLEDRAVLLRRLGEIMAERPEIFGATGRPAGIFDMIITPFGYAVPHTADVGAHDILSQLLASMSEIWPASNYVGNVPLGDCWRHPDVRGDGMTDGWMPLHKLSQWMTYSLLEPFEWAGVKVHDVDQLTGLPEYRNGGFFLDTGVLRLRDEAAASEVWNPGDEIIVEWRALTVALLDELARSVRERLRLDAVQLPLARLLEGGTWAAGRDLAQQRRGGLPPLKVASDGTVF